MNLWRKNIRLWNSLKTTTNLNIKRNMGLLNKKDKNEVIIPTIKSIQYTDGYGNLEDAAKDKMAYKEWLISMYEMEDKEVRFEDWAQVLYSILPNLTPDQGLNMTTTRD